MQKCCIVIPCYNEAERILVDEFVAFVNANPNFSLLFVNDGSTDHTQEVLEKLCANHPNINFVSLPTNQGKAEAVRKGLLSLIGKGYFYLGFWDADLSTPLSEAVRFIACFESTSSIKIVIGTRFKRLGSNIERSTKRHIFGRIFATFTSNILNLPVYDSQCGAKIFEANLVEELFKEKFITKWIFDVELLARYQNLVGRETLLKSVIELPLLEWKEVSGSKISLFYLLKVPFELLKIRNYYFR
ncbi:MAG TPA: glycosyltransferase family 2 protein [Vicingus sp.]|nr:glycosyltransferase family 2 protein [Vicingus sp.]